MSVLAVFSLVPMAEVVVSHVASGLLVVLPVVGALIGVSVVIRFVKGVTGSGSADSDYDDWQE